MKTNEVGILAVIARIRGEDLEAHLMGNAFKAVSKALDDTWVDCACGQGDYDKSKQSMCDGCLRAERELYDEPTANLYRIRDEGGETIGWE